MCYIKNFIFQLYCTQILFCLLLWDLLQHWSLVITAMKLENGEQSQHNERSNYSTWVWKFTAQLEWSIFIWYCEECRHTRACLLYASSRRLNVELFKTVSSTSNITATGSDENSEYCSGRAVHDRSLMAWSIKFPAMLYACRDKALYSEAVCIHNVLLNCYYRRH